MYLENLNKFIRYYGKNKRRGLIFYTGLSLLSACLELLGVALVYPFIILIIDPSSLNNIPIFHSITIPQNSYIPILLGITVFCAFILKNLMMICSQYVQSKFVSKWRMEIVNTFMNYFLYAPYKDTMKYSAAEKLYLLEGVVGSVIGDFVVRSLNLLTNSIILLIIITFLLITFPIPAIVSFVVVCVSLILQNKFFKKKTLRIAEKITPKSRKYKSLLVQNIQNIKELKILSAEEFFNNGFVKEAEELNNLQILQGFYSSVPPYIIETLIILGLLVMAIVLSFQKSTDGLGLIASFGLVAAALFRIAPALNRIQTSIININISRNFVKVINSKYEAFGLKDFEPKFCPPTERIPFKNSIKLENVCFSYNNTKEVLKNISLEINKGDFIGIIGLSGAGKSTLADVIMGLLPISKGQISVDGESLTSENFPKFRQIIGYVPQQINMTEQSFKENVAWGCEQIDEERVKNVLKLAQLYDIIKDYPQGIDTVAQGSNGLSQGQKQRLAIARALYRNPELIILDEATSALDVQVEHEITKMLSDISENTTIIAIAHRLSTLKACNKLIYIKDGCLVDIGTFSELSEKYPDFSKLVKLSAIETNE